MNNQVTVPLTHGKYQLNQWLLQSVHNFHFSDDMILNSFRATRREAGDLERLVEVLQHSETNVKNTAFNKLEVIAQQIKFLQKQASDILSNASKDSELHKIHCNFVKKPGQIYYIYERPTGEKFWSMISPEEFGANCKNEHQGSYRMEIDSSFTRADELHDGLISESRRFAETLMKQTGDVPAIKFIANNLES